MDESQQNKIDENFFKFSGHLVECEKEFEESLEYMIIDDNCQKIIFKERLGMFYDLVKNLHKMFFNQELNEFQENDEKNNIETNEEIEISDEQYFEKENNNDKIKIPKTPKIPTKKNIWKEFRKLILNYQKKNDNDTYIGLKTLEWLCDKFITWKNDKDTELLSKEFPINRETMEYKKTYEFSKIITEWKSRIKKKNRKPIKSNFVKDIITECELKDFFDEYSQFENHEEKNQNLENTEEEINNNESILYNFLNSEPQEQYEQESFDRRHISEFDNEFRFY